MKSLQLPSTALWLIAGFVAYGVIKFLFYTAFGSIILLSGILLACAALQRRQKP